MDWQDIVIKGSEYPVDENQDCNDENQNNVEDKQDSAEESCGMCSKVLKNKESLRKHHCDGYVMYVWCRVPRPPSGALFTKYTVSVIVDPELST